jgi:hypothetical protein
MIKDEALRLALDAFERSVTTCFTQYSHQQVMSHPEHFINQAITAIKEALAQPQREWVSLTDEEIGKLYRDGWSNNMEFARAIEAKLKEKNT